mmetsp:Transcript_22951/g.36066  ORF Transcript_22951/g.36066 Transcript_22951/m.36066 type:complete len:728 (-) Transcript_22951:387-2570(-)
MMAKAGGRIVVWVVGAVAFFMVMNAFLFQNTPEPTLPLSQTDNRVPEHLQQSSEKKENSDAVVSQSDHRRHHSMRGFFAGVNSKLTQQHQDASREKNSSGGLGSRVLEEEDQSSEQKLDELPLEGLLAEEGVKSTISRMQEKFDERVHSLLQNVKTPECAEKVLQSFEEYHKSFTTESQIPFEMNQYKSECIPEDKEKYESDETKIPVEDIAIVFVLIVHENPNQVIRLINALQHPKHSYVIHVDKKPSSESTYQELLSFSKSNKNVHVMKENRVSISWGGFSVVQATLNGMKHALALGLPFHWLANLSGYTYPLAAVEIYRRGLSELGARRSYMEIRPKPHDPNPRAWHHFVECDDALHRLTRLQRPKELEMFVGSQWFTVSREFVEYVANGEGFAGEYANYAKNLVVADENYFGTVMKNSRLCHTHTNRNFHHIQFDEWEHSKGKPNPKKCLQPNPNHCGRSPATITVDYIPVLEKSTNLFARKFDEKVDSKVLDYLDRRMEEKELSVRYREGPVIKDVQLKQVYSDGQGRAEELCLELPTAPKGRAHMAACDPTNHNQVFKIGSCSLDGDIRMADQPDKCMEAEFGNFSVPFCPLQAANGRCLDLEGESKKEGGSLISYGCTSKWNQLFGFGIDKRKCKIFMNIPHHYVLADPEHIKPELCLEARVIESKMSFSGLPGALARKNQKLEITTAACGSEAMETQNFIVSPVRAPAEAREEALGAVQ